MKVYSSLFIHVLQVLEEPSAFSAGEIPPGAVYLAVELEDGHWNYEDLNSLSTGVERCFEFDMQAAASKDSFMDLQ